MVAVGNGCHTWWGSVSKSVENGQKLAVLGLLGPRMSMEGSYLHAVNTLQCPILAPGSDGARTLRVLGYGYGHARDQMIFCKIA